MFEFCHFFWQIDREKNNTNISYNFIGILDTTDH